MANKYCDHGAYGSGTGVASTSGSSTTLTIASTSAGVFGLGSELSGTGITAGTYITALGTYNGSSGTVTMSAAMTVAASTAITGIYGQPLNVPSAWGVPQDGDGTATTAATASATISFDIAAWTFTSGSSTFSIMGSTAMTVGAGANSATNAQYSATAATMAANIAAAINLNAYTNMVNIPSGWVTNNQVRNVVYAKATGSVVAVMTRAGSAGYNTLVAMTFANVTGASSQSWSGGSGGCWGYIYNRLAGFLPSAIAAITYGIWTPAKTIAGEQANGDDVKIRAGKTVKLVCANVTTALPTVGSAAAPVTYTIDDSTVWSDGADPVLSILGDPGGGYYYWGIGAPTTCYAHIKASRYADGSAGLNITAVSSGGGNVANTVSIAFGGPVTFENVDLIGYGHASPSLSASYGNAAYAGTTLIGCKIRVNTTQASGPHISNGGSTNTCNLNLYDFEINVTNATAPATAIISGHVSYGDLVIEGSGLKLTGFVTGSTFMGTPNNNLRVLLNDVSWGGVTLRGPFLNSAGASYSRSNKVITCASSIGSMDFLHERPDGFVEWNSGRSHPTLNAKLRDGTSPWSIHAIPTSAASILSKAHPLCLPEIVKLNSLADGVRTAKVEIACETNLAFTRKDISLVLTYVGTDGDLHSCTTLDYGSALTASSETWSAEAAGQVTFSDGGTIYHDKYYLSITTPTAIKTDTFVRASIRIHTATSNIKRGVFVDPEITLT